MAEPTRDPASDVPVFGREFFRAAEPVSRIGSGSLGGKARGLVLVRDLLRQDGPRPAGLEVDVPRMVVIATGIFDAFVERNGLAETIAADLPDARTAHAFQAAALPVEIVGDLRAIVEEARTPLAVRSSSLLEDALHRPFAGVYETKMVPNNEPDADSRFRRLSEAIKLVYASTCSRAARSYRRATGAPADEKMAVVVQEVVGARHGDRFYPDVSGVARSYDFFPVGAARREDGVVNLALGLGKTIVDGGTSWIYSPARPKARPPCGSIDELLESTQREFWAVHMGPAAAYDPLSETEHLVRCDLGQADYDDTLARIASTYDATRDRVVPGTAVAGPRVLDFAPLLVHGDGAVNGLIGELLALGERALGGPVEIEFALQLGAGAARPGRFGLLQLRPMLVSEDVVEIGDDELASGGVLVESRRAMGNGAQETLQDVVYVRPATFEARATREIAVEVEQINRVLVEQERPYLLVGFGRWGSSDPWLGIPVVWGQIAGARAIVESTLAGMDVDPSQGAHFFHNLIAQQVFYLCVRHTGGRPIDWAWLDAQPAVVETPHVRHVRLADPLRVKVDGRTGRGAIWHSYNR